MAPSPITKPQPMIVLVLYAALLLLAGSIPTVIILLVTANLAPPDLAVLIANPIVLGTSVGGFAATITALVSPIRPLNLSRWFALNVIGAIANLCVSVYASATLADQLSRINHLGVVLLAAFVLFSACGTPWGFLQWLYLRTVLTAAYRWIIAASVSWGFAGVVLFVLRLAFSD
jgi:hypothetical protein